jgi:hypothetical protein
MNQTCLKKFTSFVEKQSFNASFIIISTDVRTTRPLVSHQYVILYKCKVNALQFSVHLEWPLNHKILQLLFQVSIEYLKEYYSLLNAPGFIHLGGHNYCLFVFLSRKTLTVSPFTYSLQMSQVYIYTLMSSTYQRSKVKITTVVIMRSFECSTCSFSCIW